MNIKIGTKKKTNQGNGRYSKHKSKGSACSLGGRTPKGYKKKYRGQGKK